MLAYIIKSGLCLLVLFSFYKLFLESENFHKIKRIYLILTLVVSLILPLITFSYTVEIPVEQVDGTIVWTASETNTSAPETSWWQRQLPNILLVIYSIGFLVFSIRFIKNLRALVTEANRNDQLKDLPYIYVLLHKKLAPYSFFQYIFLNKKDFQNEKIASAVIEHEKAHVDQKHSFDLLFIRLVQIIFWFNPVFIFMQRSIRLNHEFLADARALQKAYSPLEYSNILFQYSSGHHHNSLSSPINHSLIKKRIIMITRSFSLKRLVFKSIIFLPVLGGCVYLFNEDIVAKPIPANSDSINISEVIQEQDRKIRITVEDEKILLNGRSVVLNDFSEAIDKLTANWPNEEKQKPWFEIDFEKSTTPFIQKLNKEYRKSRLSQISDTEFLAPGTIALGVTPPPPPPPPVQRKSDNVPPPPPPASKHTKQSKQKESLFSIQVNGDQLKVNGNSIKLTEFGEILDGLTAAKSEEELKNANFHMQIIDPVEGFMKEINREFKKSRLSQITGHDMLPPPPPPPAPPKRENVAHLDKDHRERAEKWKQMKNAERKVILEERKEIMEMKRDLHENKQLTKEDRANLQKDVRRKQIEIERKMKEIERKRRQVKREHIALERTHRNPDTPLPPSSPQAPDPLKSIKELESEGGSFYLNGKKISAKEASDIVKSGKYSRLEISQTGDSNGKLEITKN